MIFKSGYKERRCKVEGRYEVSDLGVVYSDGMPLTAIDGVGVNLHGKRVKIAYLVARAFVPNQECRPWVRHKNGDVKDNRASNLEWCDEKEERRRGRKTSSRWCKAWTLDGDVVGMWPSVMDASIELGLSVTSIRSALYGKQRTAGGKLWRWV